MKTINDDMALLAYRRTGRARGLGKPGIGGDVQLARIPVNKAEADDRTHPPLLAVDLANPRKMKTALLDSNPADGPEQLVPAFHLADRLIDTA